jgi:hypothetical protein
MALNLVIVVKQKFDFIMIRTATYTYTFNDLLICVLLSFAVKIGLFYIVYYTFLTGFFIGMLLIFYQTLDDKEPKWQNSNGIIGSNPGKTHLLLYLNI